MALDKTGIDAIQAFYLEHRDEVYVRSFADPIQNDFVMVTNKDGLLLASGDTDEVLQAYQPGHHAKGTVTLDGRLLRQEMVKVDQTIESRRFDKDYYFSYLNRSNNDPYQMPYEAWAAQLVMDQMYEDFVLKVLWGGVKGAVTPGTPTTAAATANGFLKLIDDEVTALTITPVVTGAILANTAVAQIRNFVKGALTLKSQRRRLFYVYCSQDMVDKYQENYEALIGPMQHSDDPYALTRIHGTNSFLVPQDGLTGDELIMTRADNFVVSFDGPPAINMFLWERYIRTEIDWKYGLNFHSVIELWVNNQL